MTWLSHVFIRNILVSVVVWLVGWMLEVISLHHSDQQHQLWPHKADGRECNQVCVCVWGRQILLVQLVWPSFKKPPVSCFQSETTILVRTHNEQPHWLTQSVNTVTLCVCVYTCFCVCYVVKCTLSYNTHTNTHTHRTSIIVWQRVW